MLKRVLVILLFVSFFAQSQAQELLSPSYAYSHKKTAYITLKDGTEIKGTLKDVDRKKGLVKYVKIEDGEGTKHKLKPESIAFMYLPPSGLDNLRKATDMMTDVNKWTGQKLDQDLVNQGYAYLENAKVKVKKKEMELLMQLLNPTFCKVVKVYDDPMAKETASLGVAGVSVVGGLKKSYYVQLEGDKAAYKLEKKRYKKEFKPLWSKCETLIQKYPEIKWSEFTDHVKTYTECQE